MNMEHQVLNMIEALERQKEKIEATINNLRELGGLGTSAPSTGNRPSVMTPPASYARATPPAKGKKQMSPEARERIKAAQKARWEAIRNKTAAPPSQMPGPPPLETESAPEPEPEIPQPPPPVVEVIESQPEPVIEPAPESPAEPKGKKKRVN